MCAANAAVVLDNSYWLSKKAYWTVGCLLFVHYKFFLLVFFSFVSSTGFSSAMLHVHKASLGTQNFEISYDVNNTQVLSFSLLNLLSME